MKTFLLLALSTLAQAAPPLPTGLDAYRLWNLWPYQRIGERAYMRSTYDRAGGNEHADASHFLYQTANDFNVTLDLQGRGILYLVPYNHWHGSPWHYEVDGHDTIVRETSTADPLHPNPNSVFEPRELFPSPLAFTWSDTKGADLSWLPVAFEKSFRMAYSRTMYGTGYYIYHQFVDGTPLTQPIRSWDAKTPPAQDVLDLINRSGTDIAPQGREETGRLTLKGPAMLRRIWISIPQSAAEAFAKARLRITWDNRPEPSVDAPAALFFGAGTFYNRDHREYLVKAFPMNVRFVGDRIEMACYFPMPFFRSARIELTGAEGIPGIQYSLRTEPLQARPSEVGYFHATYRDHPAPEQGKDLVLLDTTQAEGSPVWSGSFVGTSFIFSHNAVLRTLEGDPRFFFDDSRTPQAQGTGTEEWGGGGDYWGGRNMTLPFAGHPAGAKSAKEALSDEDKVETAYRFLLADLMPFGRNARIQLEHGGVNESTEHYETVAYWYGIPAASLIPTDELRIGDAASERKHRYVSPEASAPYEITSRYEWGPDHTAEGKEIYPVEKDRGRTTRTTSEFMLRIDPRNLGVMLRRKLDYQFPNQRAEVFVDGVPAGVWYLAGSNTCVYSAPSGELGATEHIVQTSNRRFRDDEFLIPLKLTRGRRQIRVKIKFTPADIPLFPGHPLPEQAWSEIRYTAYSYVKPKF